MHACYSPGQLIQPDRQFRLRATISHPPSILNLINAPRQVVSRRVAICRRPSRRLGLGPRAWPRVGRRCERQRHRQPADSVRPTAAFPPAHPTTAGVVERRTAAATKGELDRRTDIGRPTVPRPEEASTPKPESKKRESKKRASKKRESKRESKPESKQVVEARPEQEQRAATRGEGESVSARRQGRGEGARFGGRW